ncbi:MAG: PEP-CTERM sorting domain-containing protein [Verrucomicrobia bacterium]|nr:PEP-CTERM sorting domain-containing protein [Verrucomicrobiota bacterium]
MKRTLLIPSLIILLVSSPPDASASVLFGVRFSGLTDLYQVDQTSGSLSSIGPSGRDWIGDLTSDTRPGSQRIWGVRISENRLYEFDPVTGAGSPGAVLNSPDNMVSLAFDPVGGKLYGNTSLGFGAPFDALYEIDPATGNSTFIGRIGFNNVYALAFDQAGQLFGVADASKEFISISTATGNGALIAPLRLSLAFDIASRPEDNTMFLADSGTFSLYTIDTANGLTSLVGPYGQSENIVGLAFSAIPEPSTLASAGLLAGLAVGSHLWRRRRAARS